MPGFHPYKRARREADLYGRDGDFVEDDHYSQSHFGRNKGRYLRGAAVTGLAALAAKPVGAAIGRARTNRKDPQYDMNYRQGRSTLRQQARREGLSEGILRKAKFAAGAAGIGSMGYTGHKMGTKLANRKRSPGMSESARSKIGGAALAGGAVAAGGGLIAYRGKKGYAQGQNQARRDASLQGYRDEHRRHYGSRREDFEEDDLMERIGRADKLAAGAAIAKRHVKKAAKRFRKSPMGKRIAKAVNSPTGRAVGKASRWANRGMIGVEVATLGAGGLAVAKGRRPNQNTLTPKEQSQANAKSLTRKESAARTGRAAVNVANKAVWPVAGTAVTAHAGQRFVRDMKDDGKRNFSQKRYV